MKSFKFCPLALAVLAVGAPIFSTNVSANEDLDSNSDERSLEEVIVIGSFRDSLASALGEKRNASGFVDAVMAEDIADFPDNNLAESLQRIPGVAITRAAGEGRQISVRGLGPDYTRVRINGMEAVATSGATDAVGGSNRGRGFDFNTFSSDLFSKLIVRKSASADVEEGSLGATVDLHTAKPFDYDGFTLVASGQLGYNDLASKSDPKLSFLISNEIGDSFGALLSLSYSERNIVDRGASTVRWANTNDFINCSQENCDLDAVNEAFRPRLPRFDSYVHNMDRLGISGALQYQPNDELDVVLDVLYSKHTASRNEVFMQAVLNNTPLVEAMTLVDYEIDQTNTMAYGSFTDATVRAENRQDQLSTEFTQMTLNVTKELGDSITISGLLGKAESEFDNPVQTTVVMQKSNLDFTYDYRGEHRQSPELVFGRQDSNDPLQTLSDIDGWQANSIRLRPLGANNVFDVVQTDIIYEFNAQLKIKGGLHYKQFDFETFEARRGTEDDGGITIDESTTKLFRSGVAGQPAWLIPDIDAIDQQYQISGNAGDFALSQENRLSGNYSANEKTTGLYAQLNFDYEIGGTNVRGDIGGRYIDTQQNSTAWASLGGEDRQITAKHQYSEFLPSANVTIEPIDNVLLKFSYAEVIARAGLDSIRPNVSVSVAGGNRTVSGGNPTLEPTKATNFDIGIELYFENDGLFGATVFRKEIDSFVQRLNKTQTFVDTGLPISTAEDACNSGPDGYGPACNENLMWNTSSPLNGPGGDLFGFELNYQQPFTFLPSFWSDFGVITNFTYVKSQLDYIDSDGVVQATRDLQGLSDTARSITAYYEKENFSARISSVTRSAYLTHAIGRNGNDMEGVSSTTNVDISVSYNWSDNLKLSFEGLNLTEEVDDQWVDSQGNRLSYRHETGRQFYLGVQYKL